MLERLRQLRDRLQHPGEYEQQRARRRYLTGVDHARRIVRAPYILSSVSEVTDAGPWPTAQEAEARTRQLTEAYIARQYGPVVGVRAFVTDDDRNDA